MELDGPIDSEDNEKTLNGEVGKINEKQCAQYIPILCCSYLCCFFTKALIFMVHVVVDVTKVWVDFYPPTIGHAISNLKAK